MIKVSGRITLSIDYTVKLNMTEEQFDNLSERQVNKLIDESIDWHNAMNNAEVEDVDVWDLEEVEGE